MNATLCSGVQLAGTLGKFAFGEGAQACLFCTCISMSVSSTSLRLVNLSLFRLVSETFF